MRCTGEGAWPIAALPEVIRKVAHDRPEDIVRIFDPELEA